jgi:hypothetical protein
MFLWLVEKSHLFAQVIMLFFTFKNNNTTTSLLQSLSFSAFSTNPSVYLKLSRIKSLMRLRNVNIKDKGYETPIFVTKK